MSLGRYGVLTPDETREQARKTLAEAAKGGNPIRQRKAQHKISRKQSKVLHFPGSTKNGGA